MDAIEQLHEMIEKSKKIVFFGGAGVSTESGIKIFVVKTVSTLKNTRIHQNTC